MKKSRDSFILKRLSVGPLEANCYILAAGGSGQAFVIDPGADAEAIKDFLKEESLELKFIINTHGHGDHIGANTYFDVPVYVHKLDRPFLSDPDKNLSGMFGLRIVTTNEIKTVEDLDALKLGGLEAQIIHTPGHTPGSISIKVEDVIFTGDTLFRHGVGRTDFEYGDGDLLIKSIKDKLFALNDEILVYPGHGPATTIGEEKKNNPFLR